LRDIRKDNRRGRRLVEDLSRRRIQTVPGQASQEEIFELADALGVCFRLRSEVPVVAKFGRQAGPAQVDIFDFDDALSCRRTRTSHGRFVLMPQDQASGAAASAWGKATARRIAKALDATPLSSNSNEFQRNGQRIAIKCAAERTKSVGVTYKMLDHIDLVVGAFQSPDNPSVFELLSLTPTQYRALLRPTRSTGSSSGRVGIVERERFIEHGQKYGTVSI
jgi:hypothetical protein